MKEETKKPNNKRSEGGDIAPWRISAVILGLTFVVIALLTAIIYIGETKIEKAVIHEDEKSRMGLMDFYVNSTIQSVGTDLYVASTHKELFNYFADGDPDDLDGLADEYLKMSNVKEIYDQIRFLDKNGMELVRVNYYESDEDGAYIVDESDLQDKSDRYYFTDTISLGEYGLFVSPLDLNIENGEIEQPLKPVMRVATPVFYEGEPMGIVVFNYLADELLLGMEEFYLKGKAELLMFNAGGYFIKGYSPEDEWGFMYEDKLDKTVENINPELWENTRGSNSGQFETDDGLFTYVKVSPLSLGSDAGLGALEEFSLDMSNDESFEYSWTIVSFVPKDQIFVGSKNFLYGFLIIDLFFFAFVFFLVFRLQKAISLRLMAEKSVISLNETLNVINKIIRHDVLGRLTGILVALEESGKIEGNADISSAYDYVKGSIDLVDQMRSLEESLDVDSKLSLYEVRPLLEELGGVHNMSLDINGEVTVMADQAFRSVFENLIRNAKVHAKVNELDIDLSESDGKVLIKVSDKGSGISDDLKDRVFEKGFTSGKGTGLGLFIVKRTVERYGGSIRIEDNQPNGATFVIELPLL